MNNFENQKPNNQENRQTGWEIVGEDIVAENTDEFNGMTIAEVQQEYFSIADAQFEAKPDWYQNEGDYELFRQKFENRKDYEMSKREEILGQYYAQKRSQK